MNNDHDLKIYLDSLTYMALKQRCGEEDRSMSQHIRHLIRVDIEEALSREKENGRGQAGAEEGN